MNGVILIVAMLVFTFGFCFLLSRSSKRQDRDLLQYLILLILYRKGQATESDILLYLKIEISEANCSPVPIPKKKEVSRMLFQCLKIKFITQDDSKQPFLFYELTELGEIWTEDRMSVLAPSILRKHLHNTLSHRYHA